MTPRVYISFSADVNQKTTENLIGICAQKLGEGFTEIYLLLSTLGGNVINGINLYNVLRGMPVKWITHNVGAVNSIGNVLFLVGEERYACPQSSFMFHGVGFDVQKERLEEKQLREKLDVIKNDQDKIGEIITQRTRINTDEIAKLFREVATKDVLYAKEKGIIHDVRELIVPKGAPVIQLVFG